MPKKYSRRQMFKWSLGGAVALPLTYALSVAFGRYPPRPGLKHLSAKEAYIVEAMAEAVIPPDNGLGITIRDVGFAEGVDALMETSTASGRSRLHLLIWSVEYILPGLSFYFRKFSDLSLESRQKILAKYERSKSVLNRAFVRSLKGLVVTIYYNDRKVGDRIGFIEKCRA